VFGARKRPDLERPFRRLLRTGYGLRALTRDSRSAAGALASVVDEYRIPMVAQVLRAS
jgi:hypothetical protein